MNWEEKNKIRNDVSKILYAHSQKENPKYYATLRGLKKEDFTQSVLMFKEIYCNYATPYNEKEIEDALNYTAFLFGRNPRQDNTRHIFSELENLIDNEAIFDRIISDLMRSDKHQLYKKLKSYFIRFCNDKKNIDYGEIFIIFLTWDRESNRIEVLKRWIKNKNKNKNKNIKQKGS